MNTKTFFDLKQEVQATGKCHGCGGCITFCTAINYGALEMGGDGLPRYRSVEKCIDCGLCYRICPAVSEHEEELQRKYSWSAPAGRILGIHSARAGEPSLRGRATDGGAVTGILLHLYDKGHIEGAIVTHQENGGRRPFLATTRDEIIRSAGTSFNFSGGMAELGTGYSTYSPSIQALGDLLRTGLRRIAFIGTPCQIKSLRKMQLLGIVPADAVRFSFGLFCSANYAINPKDLGELSALAGRKSAEVTKVNIKDGFLLHFSGGDKVELSLAEMARFRRPACTHCREFSAEYADISFGGVGSEEGWTTVVTRTPLGRAVFADALETTLQTMSIDEHKGCGDRALAAVLQHSARKRLAA
jgi:coenzyme F420 hydrogenase subunit beta